MHVMAARTSALMFVAAMAIAALTGCSGPAAKPDPSPQEALDLDGPSAEQLERAPCANPRWLKPPPGMAGGDKAPSSTP